MLRHELIHSCAHAGVADAAVRSIGAQFHASIRKIADEKGLEPGAYAAQRVHRFAEQADEDDWYALGAAVAHRDMPILAGLRYILER